MPDTKVKPGVYPGVDFDTYATWDAANFSVLRHFGKTPAHAQYAMMHQEEKVSTNLGHLVHSVVLEPERLETEYMVAPKVDRRTKTGKAEWAKFQQKAEGRVIVTEEDWMTAKVLLLNARSNMTLREMLGGEGINELSLVWEDPEIRVLCKARLDRLCFFSGQPYILDLKTHGFAASRHSFQRAIEQYGYHQQAAFYRRGAEVLAPLEDGIERRFAWGVLETKEPNCVRVFDADDESLELGMDEVMSYLQQYAMCRKNGAWPGWDQGMEIAGLPPWALKGRFADA